MNNNFSIEKKELTCILINIISSKMLFTYPRSIILNSGNAGWIQTFFVSLISLVFFWFLIKLYNKAEMKSIIDISGEVGGRGLKIVVGLTLTAVLLFNSSITMRALPETIKTVLLPLTPMRLILLLLGITIAYAAYMGIFSIARVHTIFIPIAGILLVGFFIFLIPNMDITNIMPILGKGTYNIFVDGLSSLSIFSDMILLFVLLPLCSDFKQTYSCAKTALIISSIVNILIVLVYNLVYSYPSSQEFLMPVYQMTRLIKIGDFFQRLEAFFEFLWSFCIMLYSSLYLFCLCRIWKEAFDLKFYKPLILPFAFIMCAVSFLPSSTAKMIGMQNLSSLISIPVCFLLPLVLIIIYRVRDSKKRRKKL